MDTSDAANGKGHVPGNGHSEPVHEGSAPSTDEVSRGSTGAPVEPSWKSVDESAGAPEPLIVIEPPKPVKLRPKQRAFLAALAKSGNLTRAEQISKVTRQSHWNWLNEVDEHGNQTPLAAFYGRLTDEAFETAADLMEIEARRRAEKGTLKPVFYEGIQCGTIREYSDRLMEFLLKAIRPDKYRERHEVTGAGGSPLNPSKVEHTHTVKEDLSALSDKELETRNVLLEKCLARSGGTPPPGAN